MRYLISGGAGFLGTTLCEYLLNNGDEVLCMDSLITGYKQNIIPFLSNPKFTFFEKDVVDFTGYIKVDGIFHLASPTAPQSCRDNVIKTIESNTTGTLNLLRLAKEYAIPLLYTSSIRVLDSTIDGPYSESKRIGELYCKEYGAKIARLGSVYGPKMNKNDTRVIPTFIRKSLNNEDIEVWGNGSQLDSFCYSDDIMRGLVSFMNSEFKGLIEFSCPESISIKGLADCIIKLTNSKSKLKFLPCEVDCVRKLTNSSRARTLLQWETKVPLNEGLRRTINVIS
jgi:nucleoside-diphosphate-sugar epimerase